MNDEILLTKEDGIATITLNRPERYNALTSEMIQEGLPEVINKIKKDDDIKVVIITGAGKGFCSGADVTGQADRIKAGAQKPRHEILMQVGPVVLDIAALDKPIIAAINGASVGAGLSLALVSDIRIASDAARFGAVWVNRCLIPDLGATYYLPRIIGIDKAQELALTGEIIDAEEALRIGLVTRVVPHDKLMDKVTELARKIAKGPAIAIELTKRGFYRALDNNLNIQLDYETYAQNICRISNDHKEGVASFLEKREPNFTGT